MDRNGFAALFLFLFLILANFSEASLLNNHGTFVVKRDSLPGSQLPNPVTEDKESNSKPANGDKSESKLKKDVVDESTKGNTLDSGLKKQPSTKDNNLDHNEGKGNDEDKKLVTEQEQKGNEEKRLDSKPGKMPKKEEEKQDPKLTDETSTEKAKPGSEQVNKSSEGKKELDSETGKDPSEGNKLDPGKVNEAGKEQPAPPPPKDSLVTKSSNDAGTASSPPPEKKKKGKDEIEKGGKSDPGTTTDEICDASKPSCKVQDLIGCIKSSDGSQVVVLVQNKGESDEKAKVAEENSSKGIESEIPKKKSKLIPISLSDPKASNIVLHGANGKCKLPLPLPGDEENPFLRFPTYDKLVTPVNGAYLLILTALIFGGTFACVKFSRRRRQGGGIPYQELEMGFPESVSATDLETAEGWDQGWDDDWDNDSAVKSPAARHAVSISANGLTSRSPNKDGWDDDWDN